MSTKLKPMRSVWHSLLWKEWHEHKWHMLGFTILLVAFSLFFLADGPNTILAVESMLLLCYGLLAGLFTGMVTAARENQRRTMPFLQSLPVSMSKPGATKLIVSCVSVSLPIVVFVAMEYAHLRNVSVDTEKLTAWAGRPGPFGLGEVTSLAVYSAKLALMSVLSTSSLLVWMATIGVNRSDEIRAGAVGFLVIVAVWIATGLAIDWADRAGQPSIEDGFTLLVVAAPGGAGMIESLNSLRGSGAYWLYFLVAGVAHALLIATFVRRFGRKTVRPARTLGGGRAPTKSDWLLPPRRSQLTAIVWKQLSETGPLAIIAAVAVLAIAAVIYWLNRDRGLSTYYSEVLAGTAIGVGYLVSVVAGMGVFLEDVKPNVRTFWQSRPVNTTTWFFVKFFTGLTVLLICFGLLFALAYSLPGGHALLDSEQPALQIGVFALVFLLTYTLSMASYCMGKHPIVAVMATLGIMYGGAIASSFLYHRVLGRWEVELAIVLILIAQATAMVIAWGALRFNWGWHK